MAKKTKLRPAPSDFETAVVAACLAEKLVRGGYGAEPSAEAVAADVDAWRRYARLAGEAMGKAQGARRKK
jgi:hypothetical protein